MTALSNKTSRVLKVIIQLGEAALLAFKKAHKSSKDAAMEVVANLASTNHHAVLVLQPTVDAFFLVHTAVISRKEKNKPQQEETQREETQKEQQAPLTVLGSEEDISTLTDAKKFLAFGETHRTVLNQILR